MGTRSDATFVATDFLRCIGLTLVTIVPIVNAVAQAPWAHFAGAG